MIAHRSIGIVAIGIAAGLMSAARAQDRGVAVPRPAEVGRWGTLRGRVVFGGEPPAPEVLIDPAKEAAGMNQARRVVPVR